MSAHSVYRAYRVTIYPNERKREQIIALNKQWRTALSYASHQWQLALLQQGTLPKRLRTKDYPQYISQRQWDSVVTQAGGAIRSWVALRQEEFRSIVTHSFLNEHTKIALYRINKRAAWYQCREDSTARLAHYIIKHLRKHTPMPSMKSCRTMSMDGKIAHVQEATHATRFRWWVTVSTLTKGKPIRVPIMLNSRLEERLARGEQLANHLQLRVNPDHTFVAYLMTTKPVAPARNKGTIVGLDWGLTSMFCTSEGQQLGNRLYRWLQQRDIELQALTASLQQSGIPLRKSKRYRAFNHRIRAYVTNEINRVLNTLSQRNIRELVVEQLDFRHGGLSKRLNRILSRAGRRAVRAKLQAIEEDTGVKITRVNPAYTSQQCSSCGYTSRKNRPTRNTFHCTCCGLTLCADMNASRNILARRSSKDGLRYISKQQIYTMLTREHGIRCQHRLRHYEYGSHTAQPSTVVNDSIQYQ